MEERTMPTLEEVRARFEADRFATENGAVIEEVRDGYARCSMTLTPSHRNAAGAVMGGAIFTLADFAFAVASNFDQTPTVTAVSQISYLGVPQGDTLTAETHLLKDGRRTCFYEIAIYDDTDTLVAVVSTTGAHLSALRPDGEPPLPVSR